MTPAKRLMDIALALVFLLLLSPLLLFVSLCVLIVDGRPILYRSERMKTPTQGFQLWKFRTMSVVETDSGVSGGDKSARITPLGARLRRTRADEMPQLLNILRGDISFVGPRPPLRRYVDLRPDLYEKVLQNRPGVTGLATLTFHATADDPLLDDARAVEWVPLLTWSDLRADHVNTFDVDGGPRVTHVRLQIAPDGGVARLRLLGEVVTDLRVAADRHDTLDLAAAVNGGVVEASSGEFFSPAQQVLQLGDARDMGDGWETRRRRDGGHDWIVVRLATTGLVDRVEVDTTHFLGNHPQTCAIDTCHRPAVGDQLAITDEDWHEAVATRPLGAHARHVFDIADPRPATHVRLRIHPDGGVARLRVRGRVTDDGWRRAGVRWLDAATGSQARTALAHCCSASRWVTAMSEQRPFATFDQLRTAADTEWAKMERDDWLEAFAAHPRIGDRSGPEHTRREQSGTADADPDVLEALAEGNRRYERQFGHVFLINAAGRPADDMLRELQERLDNDADTEAAVAAEQQRQITQRRLEAMMRPDREGGA